MNILICDDEPAFCTRISEEVQSWFDGHDILAQCTTYCDPVKLLDAPDLGSYQIAFLDVDMQPLNGISLGKQLKNQKHDIIIIYVSAYLEFAIDGYQVEAFRYILKHDLQRTLPKCLEDVLQKLSPQKKLTIKHGNSFIDIYNDDIYYFESNLRKVNIYGKDPYSHIADFYGKISSLTSQLETFGFLRIGCSHLVNMIHICQIINYQVTLDNGVSLNASRSHYSEIQNEYLHWKGLF